MSDTRIVNNILDVDNVEDNVEDNDLEILQSEYFRGKIIDEIDFIYDNEYIYSVDNIVYMLDIQRGYIQNNFCSKMDLHRPSTLLKLYFKGLDGHLGSIYRLYREYPHPFVTPLVFIQENADLLEFMIKNGFDRYKATRRTLVQRAQLIDLVKSTFIEEIDYFVKTFNGVEKRTDYSEIDIEAAIMIVDEGVVSQDFLRKFYGVNTELQVYRRMDKELLKDGQYVCVSHKYVIPSGNSNKKGLARYLIKEDFRKSVSEYKDKGIKYK